MYELNVRMFLDPSAPHIWSTLNENVSVMNVKLQPLSVFELVNEVFRCTVIERAVRSLRVVLRSPAFDFVLYILRERNQCSLRHSCRKRELNASISALSLGLRGLEKSNSTFIQWAHRSESFQMNSGPLSTFIRLGNPFAFVTPSKTSTTLIPRILWRG